VAIWRLVLPAGPAFSLLEDWRTMGVALSCAATATLLTALGPTMIARRTDLAAMLKSGAREGSGRRSRVQSALLVFQVSLSVVLLVGAGLFVRSVQNAQDVPLGYDVKNVLEVISDFRETGLNAAAKAPTRRRLLLAAKSLPGVVAVTAVNSQLFGSNTTDLGVPGIDSVTTLGRFTYQIASPDYFKVMRTKILRGRAFTDVDRIGTPLVTIVSEAMAKVLWPGKDAIGQCIKVGRSASVTAEAAPCTTVVGVAENAAQVNLTEDPRFMYYLPVEQAEPNLLSTMLLRMSAPIAVGDVERVQRDLSREMPGDGFVVVRRLQEVVDAQTRSWRMGATLFVALGGLAFVVAVVGLYGVLSYDVTGRMHELGVRVALGAQPSAVVRLVVGQGLRFAVIGVSVGLALALVASRWVQPLLFKLSARDPFTYGAIGLSMLLVAIAASWAPAVRASRADLNAALRAD
jgi:predicted permease